MKQRSSAFIFGIVASIILGFGIIALIALGLRSDSGLGSESGVFQATKTSNGATLDLSTFPDAQVCHADAGEPQVSWVTYCAGTDGLKGLATNIEVPPNSDVTVTIYQYDSGTALVNDYFRQVRGTVGGATLNGQPFSNVSDVPAIMKMTKGTNHTYDSDPGHTFTIQSTPNSPDPLFVSVPLIGVSSDPNTPMNVNINGNMYPTPNIIQFTFHTGPVGTVYLWHCYDPCGDTQYARNPPYGFSGPMWTLGYMAGMITVTNY